MAFPGASQPPAALALRAVAAGFPASNPRHRAMPMSVGAP
ncbi:hypothetical protein YPPY01_2174, partial [Yersinia pestis PY-01]